MEGKKENELFKENYLLLCVKEKMSLKIIELEKKLSKVYIFLGLENDNRKHKKRKFLEGKKKLLDKVLELKEKLKTVEEENNESRSDDSLI